MVMVCAILGSIAMGMMFDPAVINESTDSFKSYVSNGAYWSFQKLGEYYHVGNLLLVIYAACNAIGQFSTLVLSIDAPLRILLDNEDARQFVPSGLLKKNEHGAYINGIKMVICLSGSIILIQSFNTGLTMVNVPSFWQYVAKGGLLLFALTTDYIRKQKREKDLLAASMKNL